MQDFKTQLYDSFRLFLVCVIIINNKKSLTQYSYLLHENYVAETIKKIDRTLTIFKIEKVNNFFVLNV